MTDSLADFAETTIPVVSRQDNPFLAAIVHLDLNRTKALTYSLSKLERDDDSNKKIVDRARRLLTQAGTMEYNDGLDKPVTVRSEFDGDVDKDEDVNTVKFWVTDKVNKPRKPKTDETAEANPVTDDK